MENKIILVSSKSLGSGNEELGEVLLENFFTLLNKNETLPKVIFFMNEGVLLLDKSNLISLQLEQLEEKGVQLLACKTCVEFYELDDKLSVGSISTMAKFIELSSKLELITLC